MDVRRDEKEGGRYMIFDVRSTLSKEQPHPRVCMNHLKHLKHLKRLSGLECPIESDVRVGD